MAESRAAVRYAKAVLSVATDAKIADVVNTDMKQIANALAESKELKEALLSPVVRSSDKQAVLSSIFGDANSATTNLISTLIANKRIALLEDVAVKYSQLYDALRDTQVAEVTTAVPLTKELEEKVLEKVKSLTGKATEIENTVDESILGGFILRVGLGTPSVPAGWSFSLCSRFFLSSCMYTH